MTNSSLKPPGSLRVMSLVRVLAATTCGVAFFFSSANIYAADAPAPAPSQSAIPDALKDAALVDHPGAEVPADLTFKDETGNAVQLGSYFKGKPVILTLGYYGCPMLCSLVLNGVLDAVKALPAEWKPGNKFEIVSVSIDPHETPEDARAKRASYIEALGKDGAQASWHFLTTNGDEAQVRKLASQVGFGYKWDPVEKQYAHGAGIFVITPDRKVSRTLYGITFRPQDLKFALLEASNGRIGTVIDRLLLFCYQYNSHTRKYSIVATRLVQAGSAGTVLFFGGYLAVFWRRQSRRPGELEDSEEENDSRG